MTFEGRPGSGHGCCFDAHVVDTSKKHKIGEHEYDLVICECFDLEMAERIASAMNVVERPN